MKGILLAGGKGTRLYPITRGTCKQLLAVYNKPLIYYPLSFLMFCGIKDILIISTPKDTPRIKDLLSDGSSIGIKLNYSVQPKPRGIAESFIIGEKFIGSDKVCLILGDNIFYAHSYNEFSKEAAALKTGAVIFTCRVKNPQRYGVVEFDKNNKVVSIQEKPKNPKSKQVVTGFYFYDNKVVRFAKELKPSSRKELEITDINNRYLKEKKLKAKMLEPGNVWLDAGTYESLMDAAMFIKTIEERQGFCVGSIEEAAYKMGYIDKRRLLSLAEQMNTSYGDYLKMVAADEC